MNMMKRQNITENVVRKSTVGSFDIFDLNSFVKIPILKRFFVNSNLLNHLNNSSKLQIYPSYAFFCVFLTYSKIPLSLWSIYLVLKMGQQ